MKYGKPMKSIVAVLAMLLLPHIAVAQPATSTNADGKYVVDTRIGKLRFEHGYPTKETAKRLYDEMDFQRAVQAYLWSVPLVSMQALHERLQKQDPSLQSSVIFEDLLPPSTRVFTGNNTTLYAISTFIIKPDDPVVLEIPAGAVLGMINNAWQQALADLGPPGPDKGKGGKYLILPPQYKGEVPKSGYFVLQSDSFQNYYLLRAFETGAAGVKKLKEISAYRWSERNSPPKMTPYNASPLGMELTYPVTDGYFAMLARAIENEYPREQDKAMLGILATLGIAPGVPFKPDARMKKTLAEAAEVGSAMAVNLSFNARLAEAQVWPDRQYAIIFLGGNPSYENEKRQMVDERTNFAHQAFSTAQSMSMELVGKGSAYFAGFKDADGTWLNGSKTYRIRVPRDVPARTFWAVNVYDTGTRSMINTKQGVPGLDGNKDLIRNQDGSVDIFIGPKAPRGMEKNWIQTIPDRGFFIYFRLYGPEKSWFDRSWKLDDIEKVN